jgi:hypothetical protein
MREAAHAAAIANAIKASGVVVLTFFTKSRVALVLPSRIEVIQAKATSIPEE